MSNSFIQHFLNNDSIKIQVLFPEDTGIVFAQNPLIGYIEDDVKLSSQANWQNLVEGNKSVQNIQALAQGLGSDTIPMFLVDTIARWAGTDIPNFNFSFYIFCLNENDVTIEDRVKPLLYGTFPTAASQLGALRGISMHYGYNPGESILAELTNMDLNMNPDSATNWTPPQGSLTVKVGNRMMLTGMIMQGYSVDMSPENTKKGGALYARVNLSLRPYMLPSAQQMEKFFITPPPVNYING